MDRREAHADSNLTCDPVCSEEVSSGLHSFNGMLVALLMGLLSSAGALPVCLCEAAIFSLQQFGFILGHWDLPVSVLPFNTVILLYLVCTGTSNPYFPNYPAQPPGAPESTNHTQLHVLRR
ncbi:urea transporter 2-like [Cyprinus carpio]|uniref:Urea transporter 2-like n=1 Tax=Cyprinus carpio TaxID=7962 RepID=A0A9Q9YBR7_CYPCA|nr:urea transporter 2-like [Cyprinus carpio]